MSKQGFIRQNVDVPEAIIAKIRERAGVRAHGAIQSFIRRGIDLAYKELESVAATTLESGVSASPESTLGEISQLISGVPGECRGNIRGLVESITKLDPGKLPTIEILVKLLQSRFSEAASGTISGLNEALHANAPVPPTEELQDKGRPIPGPAKESRRVLRTPVPERSKKGSGK